MQLSASAWICNFPCLPPLLLNALQRLVLESVPEEPKMRMKTVLQSKMIWLHSTMLAFAKAALLQASACGWHGFQFPAAFEFAAVRTFQQLRSSSERCSSNGWGGEACQESTGCGARATRWGSQEKTWERYFDGSSPHRTAQKVEEVLNEHLQQHHERVHGHIFKIKATPSARKKQQGVQLKCAICKHNSDCHWQGLTTFNTTTLMLNASYIKDRAQGLWAMGFFGGIKNRNCQLGNHRFLSILCSELSLLWMTLLFESTITTSVDFDSWSNLITGKPTTLLWPGRISKSYPFDISF